MPAPLGTGQEVNPGPASARGGLVLGRGRPRTGRPLCRTQLGMEMMAPHQEARWDGRDTPSASLPSGQPSGHNRKGNTVYGTTECG